MLWGILAANVRLYFCTFPFVLEWYSVVVTSLERIERHIAPRTLDVIFVLLSMGITSGIPCGVIQFSRDTAAKWGAFTFAPGIARICMVKESVMTVIKRLLCFVRIKGLSISSAMNSRRLEGGTVSVVADASTKIVGFCITEFFAIYGVHPWRDRASETAFEDERWSVRLRVYTRMAGVVK